ncbi:MAG: DUF3500 domain-containing protein [Planctomycetota bacterium]
MISASRAQRALSVLGCTAVLIASAVASRGELRPRTVGEAMAARADALLDALADRADAARAAHDDPERTQWAFGPVRREGVSLGGLTEGQMQRLEDLLDTALSESGLAAWREVRAQEIELRRRESTPERVAVHRDPDLYWVRVYGVPSATSRWSWRFEGHHFALHVDCRPGEAPSVTPFFVGANPLFLEGEGGEESIGVALFESLNERYGGVRVETGANDRRRPGDVRMAPGSDALPPTGGVALARLDAEQRAAVLSLLTTYLDLLDPDLRAPYGLRPDTDVNVCFERWGGSGLREPRAWCLRTPRFALELVTTDGPHHVHVLLRDAERDFGGR